MRAEGEGWTMPETRRRNSESLIPLLIIAGLLLVLYIFWSVFLIFILSAFFAFIIHPVVHYFDRRVPHIFSIIIVYLIIAILLIILIGVLAPVVSAQTRGFIETLPELVDQIGLWIEDLLVRFPPAWRDLANRALVQLEDYAVRLTEATIPAALAFLSGLLALIFVPLLAFFMLLDYRGFKHMILAVTPRHRRPEVDNLLTCMGAVLWNFIKARLILMTAVGVVTGFGLYAVGMPYAVFFGIVAGILEVIPTFGPAATTILVALVGLSIDPSLAIWAVAVALTVQILENIFLSPVVMAKTVGMHPITVILALFIGGSVAGILGALIAIPLTMMIKIVVLYYYVKDDELPIDRRKICIRRRSPPRRRRAT